MSAQRFSRSSLPNKPGFSFIGVSSDGEEFECQVRLSPAGCLGVYRIIDNSPFWFQLDSWMHKTTEPHS